MPKSTINELVPRVKNLSLGFSNESIDNLEESYRDIHSQLKVAYELEADIFEEMKNHESRICSRFINLEKNSLLPRKKQFYEEFLFYGDSNTLNIEIIKNGYNDLKKRLIDLIEATKDEKILADISKEIKERITALEESLNEEIGPKDSINYALVLKGGGIKGIAYIGALEVIKDYYTFNWFAGTSAGAISATLLAAGIEIKELKEILLNKNFEDFKDAKFFGKWINFFSKKGFYEANTFEHWLDEVLTNKFQSPTRVTLKDIYNETGNRVSIYACRKDKNALIFDSNQNETKYVSFAARCSMSIPFFFTPQKSEGLDVFDGGLRNNYPVDLVLNSDEKTKFLGLYLGNELYEGPIKRNFFSFIKDIFTIWQEANDVENLTRFREQTIIIDPRPIKTTDFNLSNEEKEFLLECGRLAAAKYLKKQGYEIDTEDYEYRKRELEIKRNHITLARKRRKKKKQLIRLGILTIFLIGYITILILK